MEGRCEETSATSLRQLLAAACKQEQPPTATLQKQAWPSGQDPAVQLFDEGQAFLLDSPLSERCWTKDSRSGD